MLIQGRKAQHAKTAGEENLKGFLPLARRSTGRPPTPLRSAPLCSASLTGADCLLGREAGLGAVRRDALDGRQGDVGVGAGQPRGLGLLGPALQVARLQGVGPAPPAAHGSASGRLGSTWLLGSSSRRRTTRKRGGGGAEPGFKLWVHSQAGVRMNVSW